MKQRISSTLDTIMTGDVIIPYGVDRGEYIKTCKRKNRISVLLSEGGGVVHNCYIGKSCISNIEFPDEFGQAGSPVLMFNSPFRKTPMVFEVFEKEDGGKLLEEHQDSMGGKHNESQAEVFTDKEQGIVNINTKSKDNPVININVSGENAILNLQSTKAVNIISNTNLNIKSYDDITIQAKNVDNDKVIKLNLKEGTFKINEGAESIPLGNTLKKQLEYNKARVDTIINALSGSAVFGGDGGATYKANILSVLQSIVNTENYSNINSEVSFTD